MRLRGAPALTFVKSEQDNQAPPIKRGVGETALLLLLEASLAILVAQKLDDLPDFFRRELI